MWVLDMSYSFDAEFVFRRVYFLGKSWHFINVHMFASDGVHGFMHITYFGHAEIMLGVMCFPTKVALHVWSAVTYVFIWICAISWLYAHFAVLDCGVRMCVVIFLLGCSSIAYLGFRQWVLACASLWPISHLLDAKVESGIVYVCGRGWYFTYVDLFICSSEVVYICKCRSCCCYAELRVGLILF